MSDLRIVDAPEIPTEEITGSEKLPTGGNGNYSISLDSLANHTKTSLDLANKTDVQTSSNGVKVQLDQHKNDLNNPHQVTKGQVGLGNVDNTADADKPMSNIVQSAITTLTNNKADKTSVYLKTETYNKIEVDSALATKPNSTIVYTKTEVNDLLNSKVSSVNGKTGTAIALNRSDLGIPSDIVMQQWEKEAKYVIDDRGLNQQEINNSNLTVDNFGAKGDGVTDDSDAFQAYIDSALTSNTVYTGKRRAKYCIKKTVDFKGKGIVGGNSNVQGSAITYNDCIYVPDGFVGTTVFKNIEGNLHNLNVKQQNADASINFAHITPYQTMVSNLNIDGFGYQIWGTKETCVTFFENIISINAKKATFYFPDTGIDHTTTYFRNIHFQWGNYSFLCEGNCYGFNFTNIVIEQMLGGIKSKVFSSCVFDQFWCEGRQDVPEPSKSVIEQTTGQQLVDNYYGVFRYLGGWTSIQLEDKTRNEASGGVAQVNSQLFFSDSTGQRMVIGPRGLRTSYANWFQGTTGTPRKLIITSQDTADESGYTTPIDIQAPHGGLMFSNMSPTDYTPFTVRRVVGQTVSSPNAHYASDVLSTTECYGEFYNDTNGDVDKFHSTLMFTWDPSQGKLTGGGWTLSKISTGRYRLNRISGNTKQIINGHVLVSGLFSSTFLSHRVEAIDAYAGSWSAYRAAGGYDVFFANSAGTATDPDRFTISLTLVS